MPDLRLDLRHLRCAVAALEQGSFRRAALALDLPQSTVTRRIQLLEHQLGFLLFDRDQRGAILTNAGGAFLKEAIPSAHDISRAAEVAAKVQRGEGGELRVGMLASLSIGPLHDILYRFHRQFQGVRIVFREGTPENIIFDVAAGNLDISFVTARPEVRSLTTKQLWRESVYLVLPQSHDLNKHDVVTWDDLRDETFIVTDGGSGREIEDYIVRRISRLGFRPHIQAHDVCRESLLTLAAMGFGLTLTRTSYMNKNIAGIAYRQIAGEQNALPISAVWSAENPNRAINNLLDLAKDVIASSARDEEPLDDADRVSRL